MKKKFFFIFFSATIFFVPVFFASALTVSPIVIEFDLDQGASQEKMMTVVNEGAEPVRVLPTLFGVSGADLNGFPTIEGLSKDSVLARIISFPAGTAHLIDAKERKEIPIRVSVAPDEKPGGYYAVISWGVEEIASGNPLSGQPGVNIAISVRGNVERGVRVSRFALRDGGTFEVDIENMGGRHIIPAGTISIRNVFGAIVARIPLVSQRVLPHTTRTFSAPWGKRWVLGPHTAILEGEAGEAGRMFTRISFFVAPPLGSSIVVGFIIFLLAVVLLRSLKK